MTQSPENDAMAIDLTDSRTQSPAAEVAATLRATTLQSPKPFQQAEMPYSTTSTTATNNGNKGQQQPGSYNVHVPTLKRKNTEEEQPRKKESWASTPSSSVVYIRPALASIITAQQDDAQERDTRHEPSNDVGCTTITTTTTTASVTIAKKTEVEKKAEVVSEGRAQHPEVRPRPNHRPQKVKSNVRYQTHWKEWCIRKEFSDGDWVTHEKFTSYLRELTAPQSYTHIDIPRLSIKPLFVRSRNGNDVRRASLGTLEAYMGAVRSLYNDQCLVDGIIPNDSLGKTEVEAILKEYEILLSYTTLKRIGDGEYEDDEDEEEEEEEEEAEEEEKDDGNGDDDSDVDNINGANANHEGSTEQEELSRKENEASTALSVQESRQQSENVQEATKVDKTKKKKSKRSGRALSPVSQKQDPHFVFAGTTQRHHLTHQTYWKEWCIRKKYADGHRVTAAKFTAFAKELTALDEYYDKDNPHLCIRPFIVNVHKGADARRASKGTVRSILTAVRALYMDQCNFEKVEPHVAKDLAKTAIDGIMTDYEKLLKESPGLPRIVTPDGQVLPRETESQPNERQEAAQLEGELQEIVPQEIAPQEIETQVTEQQEIETQVTEQQEAELQEIYHREDSFQDVQHEGVNQVSPQNEDGQGSDTSRDPSLIRLKKIMKSLWNPRHSSRAQSWVIAHRDRLRLAFGFFETDSRNVLSALLPSQIYHVQIWPEDETQTPAQGIAVVVDSRKPYGDPLRYSLFLREEDVQVCPVGALAFFLLAKWTEKKSFPNFDTDEWSTEPIESFMEAPKAGDNTSSEQEGGSSSVANFAGIIGANVEERPYRSFFGLLQPSPNRQQNHNRKIPPILLTTTLPQPSVFRLPRNRILPPPDLQRQLFPFVEDFNDNSADWKMWVENIMMDRPETTNRLSEKDRDIEYFKVDYPLIRHLLFVAGLRKVILQDFAAMMACETEEYGEKKTGFDHAFAVRHPVLSSQAFREYAAQLREAMAGDPIVKARVSTEVDESVEDVIQSLEVQESAPASKTTTPTKPTTKTTTASVVRNLRKGDKGHNGSPTSDMSSSIGVARASVAAGSHGRHNETDGLLEAIQELCARVASLEQMEKQESELLTPASGTASTRAQFPIDITSQDRDTSIDMDTTMGIDMDVDADGDIRNSGGEDDTDRLRQENQNLRDKVAALERANRELSEQNERQSSSSRTPKLHALSTPSPAALRSRVVSMAHYDNIRACRNNTHTPNGHSSSRSAVASSTPISVGQDHRATTSIATATLASNNNNDNNNIIRNRNRRSIGSSCTNCEHSSLRQEVQDLRNQLEALEQEEREVLDYAAVAIESVEFLDNKVLQMEQSMHGLWTMIARNEAAKFAAAASSPGPRSPVLGMGMASPPLPPPPAPIFTTPATAATVGGHQYQDPFSRSEREGRGSRLRVDTLPLRSRMASSGSVGSGSGGLRGKTRS